tara:strand:+ start:415 stop:708 length:294 start_codon:yes stop_codon:yes gene_type:complete
MGRIQKVANRFRMKLAADPVAEMAGSFGSHMGPQLGENAHTIVNIVAPALKLAVDTDLAAYPEDEKLRISDYYEADIKTTARGYAADDRNNQKKTKL